MTHIHTQTQAYRSLPRKFYLSDLEQLGRKFHLSHVAIGILDKRLIHCYQSRGPRCRHRNIRNCDRRANSFDRADQSIIRVYRATAAKFLRRPLNSRPQLRRGASREEIRDVARRSLTHENNNSTFLVLQRNLPPWRDYVRIPRLELEILGELGWVTRRRSSRCGTLMSTRGRLGSRVRIPYLFTRARLARKGELF